MIRVLVVDDDFMVARLHSSVVAGQPGFEVAGVVSSGAHALRAVEELKPDLMLLDIYLPEMTGLEVLRRLREGKAAVDVIVISAAKDMETLRGALHGGVFQYLVKPFEIESLRRRLDDYAAHRAELSELTEARQDDVDRVFRAQPGRETQQQLPKSISADTIALVVRALEGSSGDGLSATECADATGLSRSSTRRYLEHLVTVGSAEVRSRYGVGRPERRYRLR